MNYYSDESEWKWLFNNAIDWDRIIPLFFPKFPTEDGINSKEEAISFLEELLATTGEWAANAVNNRASSLDKEPKFQSSKVQIDTKIYRKIYIRMRTNKGSFGRLYWLTDKSKRWYNKITGRSNKWHEKKFKLSGNLFR